MYTYVFFLINLKPLKILHGLIKFIRDVKGVVGDKDECARKINEQTEIGMYDRFA